MILTKFTPKINIIALLMLVFHAPFALSNVINEVGDMAITKAVQAKLLTEKDLPSTKVEVSTKNGVVELKGVLDTNQQVSKAIEAAASIDKVGGVVATDLKAKASDTPLSDVSITAIAKGKILLLSLSKQIAGNASDLSVETIDHTVHINGKAPLQSDIATIKKAVQEIKGVKEVITNIDINNSK